MQESLDAFSMSPLRTTLFQLFKGYYVVVAMIRDRMPDLLRLAREDPEIYNEPEHHEEIPMPSDTALLLQRAEKSLKFMGEMKMMIGDLKILHQGVLASASLFDANELRQKISPLMNRFTAMARKTKDIIRRIELSELEKLRYAFYIGSSVTPHNRTDITVKWEQASSSVQKKSGQFVWKNMVSWPPSKQKTAVHTPAKIRMQIILQEVLSYRLTGLVQQYYTEQKNYNVLSHRKIERQLSILGQKMKPEEIQRVVDENLPLLQRNITDEKMSGEMKTQLKEVEHFEREVLQLERNIAQLHQAFLMVSTLVTEQGSLVDSIEHHVILASDYIESSNKQLKKAGKMQDKYRKKKCLCVIVVVVILLIIGVVIAVSIISNQSTRNPRSANVHPRPPRP